MTKLAVIVNPAARGVRRDVDLPARLATIAERVVVSTSESLPSIAASFAHDGVNLVALCGGDGTGQATLSALATAYAGPGTKLPRIALLGGGTINTVARNFGIRGTPELLLRRLCERVRAGEPLPTMQQALVRANGRLGFLFAALLGARFLQRYYHHPEPTPARAAGLAVEVALSALLGRSNDVFAPASIDLDLDGHHEHLDDARLLVASTVPDVGVGMRICPRARDVPNRFQLVSAALTAAEMARQIPAVQAGRGLAGTIDRLCTRATITFTQPEPYTLDGDLFSAQRIELEVAGPIELVRA